MPAVYLRNRVLSLTSWGLEALVRRARPSYDFDPTFVTAAKEWRPSDGGGAHEPAPTRRSM